MKEEKFYYIEYTEYFKNNYNEPNSTVLQAKNKKRAIKILKDRCLSDCYKKITVENIYETSSDARGD